MYGQGKEAGGLMQSVILACGCSGTRRIISDGPYSNHLIERGLENVGRYSPDAISGQHLAHY